MALRLCDSKKESDLNRSAVNVEITTRNLELSRMDPREGIVEVVPSDGRHPCFGNRLSFGAPS